MADQRRLSEEQKRRMAEARRKAAQPRENGHAASAQHKTVISQSEVRSAGAAGVQTGSHVQSAGAAGVQTGSHVQSAGSGKKNAAAGSPARSDGKKKTAVSAASNKKPENSSNKNGSKMTAKMKRTVRRAVAGVCLASSLLIAAIPSDRSGVASAALRSEIGDAFDIVNEYNPGLDYSGDLSAYGKTSPDSNAPKLDGSSDLWSYSIVNAEYTDGEFTGGQMVRNFNYYMDSSGTDDVGVICGYNSTDTTKDLVIPNVITRCYDFYTDAELRDYRRDNYDIYEYTLSSIGPDEPVSVYNTSSGTTTTMTSSALARLFPEVQELIDAYNSSTEDPKPWPSTDTTYYGNKIDQDIINDMFASGKFTRLGNNKLDNGSYVLTAVDMSRLSSVADPDDPSHTLSPKPDLVYVVTYTGGGKNTTIMDNNGFCYAKTANVVAIGENAFKGNTNIESLTLNDGILYIGDNAFKECYSLRSVGLDDVKYIGNNVFQNCTQLSSITYSTDTQVIGNEAFKGCSSITGLVIPVSTRQIGFGAYSDCTNLGSVSFAGGTRPSCRIGEYAFFDTPLLQNVSFPKESAIALEKACFALSSSGSGSQLRSFTFPEMLVTIPSTEKKYDLYGAKVDLSTSPATVTTLNGTSLKDGDSGYTPSGIASRIDDCKYISRIGDYILANRDSLESADLHVIGNSGVEEHVPMNTFANCTGLKKVTFDEAQDMAEYDANLFRDVTKTELCVYGPATASSVTGSDGEKYAWPRRSTWNAYSGASDYVPYCYGEHYEVGYDGFLYDLSVTDTQDESSTASIINVTYLGDSGKLPEILGEYDSLDNPFTLPENVAKHPITALREGCLDELKNHIIYFEVPDGTLTELDSGVFSNAAKLEGVILGDSVVNINDGAFSNASNLEHVYWSDHGNIAYIGEDAFKTNGGKLYFHTITDDTSIPYLYAMSDDAIINATGTNICCVTMPDQDYSTGLKIIKDRNTGEVTLIDYLHYYDDELSDDTYGNLLKKADATNLTTEEQKLVDACKDITLPEVVESIDVVNYIGENNASNKNRKNWVYLEEEVSPGSISPITKRDLYSSYKGSTGDAHPGLFSAATIDTEGLLSGESEDDNKGNDVITSIAMPGVKKIPEYAFESCEQLLKADTGDACEEIGDRAFNDCTKMQSLIIGNGCDIIGDYIIDGCESLPINGISTSNNEKFTAENGILYEKLTDDPTYSIVTCVQGRSQDIISSYDDKLPQTVSMRDGAFKGCQDIARVDLSDSLLESIPEEAFAECNDLSEVRLPESVTNIGSDAFSGDVGDILSVDIPAIRINIADDAFDPDYKRVYFTTYEDSMAVTYAKNYPPKDPDIEVTYKGAEYRVIFENDDGSTYDEQKVLPGGTVVPPDTDPVPLEPDHQGYAFDSWVLKSPSGISGSNIYNNVNEDRIYRATFIPVKYTVTFRNDDFSILKEFKDVPAGTYINYEEIPVSAITPEKEFLRWNFDPSTFTMPSTVSCNVTAMAYYSPYDIPDGYHLVTFQNDDGSEFTHYNILDGANLWDPGHPTESLRHPDMGYTFDKWIFTPDKYYFGAAVSENVLVYAIFERLTPTKTPTPKGGTGTGTPTPTGPTPTPTASGNSASQNGTGYLVTVENGAGTGRYKPGDVVTITAYAATEGKVFDRWTTSNADIGFSNAYSVATTFIMPTHDVKVTATYKSANATPTASNNAARGTGTPAPTSRNNNNNNNNNNNGSASGNNANKNTPTQSGGNNGTEVRITTDTIDNNNKNMGSASVAGSTDNFVVKVTDSAAASAAVEQALRNAYGDRFQDLKYVAFDISLYDSTGTRLVTNANNLAVTITLPIPDQLVSYAGNNKAGAVVNNSLQDLAVQYTTIDGVPCMRFTATHFSPYTIYVDTQNIVKGVTDITPKTGDGIAPKWFLSAGMLSLSCILFLWKDKNPVTAKAKKK